MMCCRSAAKIRAGVHDHRRLASQLERHRGEIDGRRRHHFLSYLRRSGEEDVVEGTREQVGGGLRRAFHDGNFVRREHRADDVLDDAIGVQA